MLERYNRILRGVGKESSSNPARSSLRFTITTNLICFFTLGIRASQTRIIELMTAVDEEKEALGKEDEQITFYGYF